MNETNTIYYGFGKDYLPNWGIKEALREIYQNFIDYGEWWDDVIATSDSTFNVKVNNGWSPDSLDFLRIGNSNKNNSTSVGKHGEGLKMAFLILLREKQLSRIFCGKYVVWPEFYTDREIGECFCLRYLIHDEPFDSPFTIDFTCDKLDFDSFKDNLILKTDVLFTDNYWGEIVDKPKGNIYSGGLFVANVDNIGKSYNINPAHMKLDRDRCVPRAFDVNYASSKINEAHGKFSASDTSYSDTSYVDTIPDDIKTEFTPRKVGNEIQFTFKDENNIDQVVKNQSIIAALKRDSFFDSAIKKLKRYISKKLGLYDMLIEFKEKHSLYGEAAQDFELILERVKDK